MRGLFKKEPGLWVVVLLPLVFFSRELLGICRFAGVDHTKLNMPMKFFDVLAVRHGELPLWNPYLFTGAPHLAEGEGGTFYLLNWINHLPGDFFYWYGINIILHFIIAGIACYALLRCKGAATFPAALFAILFQLAPFSIYHLTAVALFQVLAWIPLLILLFEMVLDNKSAFWNTFWAVALTSQLMCVGSQQMLFLGMMAIAFIGIARSVIPRDGLMALRGLGFIVAASVGGLLLAALQLWPSFEFNALSNRAAPMVPEFYMHGSWLNWSRLASLILFPATDFNPPDAAVGFASSQVYIGLIPLFLVIYSVVNRDIRPRSSPYLWASLPLLILAFGWNLGLHHILTQFPPFSYFRYLGRTSVLFILLLTIPASLGMTGIMRLAAIRTREIWMSILVLILLSAILLITFLGAGQKTLPLGVAHLVVNIVLLIVFAFIAVKGVRGILPVAAVFVAFTVVVLYPFTRLMSLPTRDFRDSFAAIDAIAADDSVELKRLMVGADVWVVDPNALGSLGFSSKHWLVDAMGGCASTLREVGCMNVYLPLHEAKWAGVVYNRLFLNLRNAPQSMQRHSINTCWLMGINYILVDSPELNMPGFEPMEADTELSFHPGAYLYRNTKPYSRFFLTRNVKAYRFYDEQRFIKLLIDVTGKDEFGVVIPAEEEPVLLDDPYEPVGGEIRVVEDGFNSLKLEITSDADCYLIAREDIFPGWEAKLDGQPAKLYSADYINRAVYVSRGTHLVEFIYRPASFRHGLRITIISLIIFLLMGTWMRWIHIH